LGFSVERQYIQKLPEIAEKFYQTETTIHVADSKIGWAKAFRELLSLLYVGQIPRVDYSAIRPAGTPLKTMGGTASGPEPLRDLFEFCISVFSQAPGRKLHSIEVHDIFCKIASVIVQGSVRRSATISLFNNSDLRMRDCKSGNWFDHDPQRAMANNSIAYTEKPDMNMFMSNWHALYSNKSGEPGIFNRVAVAKKLEKYGYREPIEDAGVNPCSEIILRPNQMCNLSCVVVSPEDTEESLLEKVEIATILGTIQATVTDFSYIRKKWSKQCEEEALLGVSFTGIYDNPLMTLENKNLDQLLEKLYKHARAVNKEWAKRIGINPAAGITTVKPSGNTGELTMTASGIHPRYSEFYARTVRLMNTDPVAKFLVDNGVPNAPDIYIPNNIVFRFPMKSPDKAIVVKDVDALRQLELWKVYSDHWTDHSVSATIYVEEDEWLRVGSWVYDNFDSICGLSFLPHHKHSYKQPVLEEISEEEYVRLVKEFPHLDWERFADYENGTDQTTGTHELACIGDQCTI
jgi:ribonucleoside-triphosphate reductase